VYDLIVDMAGNHSLLTLRRVLQPTGTVVIVGTAKSSKWLGPMIDPWVADMLDRFVSQHFVRMRMDIKKEDLVLLRDLMAAGKVVPGIDRRYSLAEVPAAIEYVETGHARGKVVINL
jgi:NADPH:quinone reductase-like Zn-dependent oxidoreductase